MKYSIRMIIICVLFWVSGCLIGLKISNDKALIKGEIIGMMTGQQICIENHKRDTEKQLKKAQELLNMLRKK